MTFTLSVNKNYIFLCIGISNWRITIDWINFDHYLRSNYGKNYSILDINTSDIFYLGYNNTGLFLSIFKLTFGLIKL